MPVVKLIQTNLSSGELSSEAIGRVDIARYNNAAKRLRNVISRTLGGGKKRPGLQYLGATKNQDEESRLIPFIVSQTEAYMVEFGDLYCRFYRPDGTLITVAGSGPGPGGGYGSGGHGHGPGWGGGGADPGTPAGTPYEIATILTEDQVKAIDYAQSETGMYLFHGDVFPQMLKNFDEENWSCSSALFTTIPFGEIGDYPAADLTLSLATVGAGRTATAASAVFLASDVGRAILHKTGVSVITGYTSTTVVTIEIKIAFDSTAIPSGDWNLDASPMTTLTLSAPTMAPPEMDPPGSAVTATLSAAGFRVGDVGKHIAINGGLVKLTGYTSTTVMTGQIVLTVSSVVGAPALSWTLEAPVWNFQRGYPRTGTIHEQRLVTAGTDAEPQTLHGSRLGEELDFTRGTNDDDGFTFTISGNDSQVNLINFLVSTRDLLALSYGGEYAISGGNDRALTPTNVKIQLQSPHGSQQVRPSTVARQTIFAQRAGRKLRAMAYSFQDDGYIASDLTTLAEHVTQSGIKTMAFAQEPDPILWIVLNNGKLIACTLDKELDIIAFCPQETDGAFEDVAVMPYGDTEQVWFIVRREVNGSIVRYIERLEPDWYPIYGTASPDPDVFPPGEEPVIWGFQLDSAMNLQSATAETTWYGLDHLEGRTVKVIADGAEHIDCIVTGGEITLQYPANRILVGLMYRPVIQLLTPEVPMSAGTSQGSSSSTSRLLLRVKDTIGATVNGDEWMLARQFNSSLLGSPPEPQTGDFENTLLGWSKGIEEQTISQDHPFPFHLLAVVRTVTINQGAGG